MKYVGQSRRHSLFSFDVPSCQPSFGRKSHFTLLTDCLAGVSLEEPCSGPPTSSSGGIGWVEVFVFKPQTLWPFIYGHQDKNVSLVLKWRQLSRRNLSLCTSQHHFRVWQAQRRWWGMAPRRLKVGYGKDKGNTARSGCGEPLQEK